MDVLNDIRNALSKGELDKAIETLWANFANHQFRDHVVSIRGRYSTFEGKVIHGILTTQEIAIEENKISYSLLKILNKIEADHTKQSLKNINQQLDPIAIANKLLEILDETYKGFQTQASVRNRLYNSVRTRLAVTAGLEYEDFFYNYYTQMNEEELEFHQSIREYTEKILNTYNRKALELVIGNNTLKASIPSLQQLERHLLVWLGKYERFFANTPSLGLIYVGVHENVPFPKGIEGALQRFIDENH